MTDPVRLDSVQRFSDRADDYVRFRPAYAADAIDAMLEGLGTPTELCAADVGAGTGISARLVADRGVRVVAVEPGDDMRRVAAPHPRVSWISGRAEALPLRAGAFGLVVCAQSFHWFRPEYAVPEFARVLADHGRLVLVWNRRRKDDPCTAAYRQALMDAGADMSVERTSFDPAVVDRTEFFSSPERRGFPHEQHLDLDGLIGRARSASYAPTAGPAGERLIDRLTAVHQRHRNASGLVTLRYETEVYRWARP